MNWDGYETFCRVVEHGGFSAAARAMSRPKSTVSASVIRLEGELQARLLERTTRSLRLTEAGESLYHSVGPLFVRLREAHVEALAQGKAILGTLRIAAPYEFGAQHLSSVACEMMARHPRLKIQIDVEHASISPLDRRYDIVFSMVDTLMPASGIVARRVYSLRRGLFASPTLLATHGTPECPEQLSRLPLLTAPVDVEWTFVGPEGAVDRVPVRSPRLVSSNAEVRLQAALAGLGVARITASYCADAVQRGLLQPVLPAYACAPLPVYALLPGRRLTPAKVREFLDSLDPHPQG
jgi:DNA-binding transcriptional LysR family regulator